MQNAIEKIIIEYLCDNAFEKTIKLKENNAKYMEFDRKADELYQKIEALLPKPDHRLIDEYDAAKNMTCGYQMEMIYLQGMRDAIEILRMLKVI